jgi:hypothetical protein
VAFAWSISCTRCRFQQQAGLEGYSIYYWLGEDRFAPMPFAGAWCENCRKVTLAEEVPESGRLAERGEWWLRWLRERGTGPGDEFYERKRRGFANQLEWRSRRVGPPRCLLCRSASVSLLDLSGQARVEVPHPHCRGRLTFERGWHYHTREIWVYSVEGEFLSFGSGFGVFQPPERPLPPSESSLWWFLQLER